MRHHVNKSLPTAIEPSSFSVALYFEEQIQLKI